MLIKVLEKKIREQAPTKPDRDIYALKYSNRLLITLDDKLPIITGAIIIRQGVNTKARIINEAYIYTINKGGRERIVVLSGYKDRYEFPIAERKYGLIRVRGGFGLLEEAEEALNELRRIRVMREAPIIRAHDIIYRLSEQVIRRIKEAY